jgi:hypothetical protein
MAQKRMFDKKVVGSDKFMDLPNSSKALYFMAGMEADDKGFFQPRKLQRMCGFSDDDFKILIAKRFFITFESGVMVVTDWNKNNWLDSRRITETEYIDELNLLKLVNEKYELIDSCLADAKPMLRENSIVENSIEYNIHQNPSNFDDEFEKLWEKYPKKQGKKDALRHYINARKKNVSFETIDKGLDNYIEHLKKTKTQNQYIKQGSTWFNQECWNDDYKTTLEVDPYEGYTFI